MSRPHTIEFVKKIAANKGGICVSVEYKNNREKLSFICSEGHSFEKRFDNIMSQGQWCPRCVVGISEELCRYVFEKMFNSEFKKTTFNHKGHNLELDGYNALNKIAFEYNGRQHYEITTFLKTEKELEYRKYLDILKVEYCDMNDINLIVIPYTVKNDNISFYIKDMVGIGVDVSVDDFIKEYSYYVSRRDKIEKVINKRGGKIIEFKLDSIKVECSEGHQWDQKFSILNRGHWCRKCADLSSRRKFENIIEILDGEWIECLSRENEYIDGDSVLEFKCSNGHLFRDKVNSILFRAFEKVRVSNRKVCQFCKTKSQVKALSNIEKHGLTLQDVDNYKSKYQINKWICKSGHITEDKLRNLIERAKRGITLCRDCSC